MLWWFIGAWLASGVAIPVVWLLGMAGRGRIARDTEAGSRQAFPESHSATAGASPARSAYGIRRLVASLVMCVFRLPEHCRSGTRMARTVHLMGRGALSGLVGIGALTLLFVGSFGDSIIATLDPPSSAAVADAPAAQVAEAMATKADIDDEAGVARRGLPRESPPLGDAEQVASIQPRTGEAVASAGDDVSRQTAVAAAAPLATGGTLLIADPKVASVERGSGRPRARGPLVRTFVTGSNRGTWLFPPNMNAGGNS